MCFHDLGSIHTWTQHQFILWCTHVASVLCSPCWYGVYFLPFWASISCIFPTLTHCLLPHLLWDLSLLNYLVSILPCTNVPSPPYKSCPSPSSKAKMLHEHKHPWSGMGPMPMLHGCGGLLHDDGIHLYPSCLLMQRPFPTLLQIQHTSPCASCFKAIG